MVMDPKFTGNLDFINNFKLDGEEEVNFLADSAQYLPVFDNGFKFCVPSPPDLSFMDSSSFPAERIPDAISSPVEGINSDEDLFALSLPQGESMSHFNGDGDLSDPVLRYISQMLMEENMEDKPCMFHDPLALYNTEKSLYQALGEEYPPSFHQRQFQVCLNVESPDSNHNLTSSSSSSGGSCESYNIRNSTPSSCDDSRSTSEDSFLTSQNGLQFVVGPENSSRNIGNVVMIPGGGHALAPNVFSSKESLDANKFVLNSNQLIVDVEPEKLDLGEKEVGIKEEKDDSFTDLRGGKVHNREEIDFDEERSYKQSAVYKEETELTDLFDNVLLYDAKVKPELCVQHVETKSSQKVSGKSRTKRSSKKKETVDLRTLLILCAQAVSGDDRRTASELLRQIRQHSSPLGDGSQRVAHFFANGLEARLEGSRTKIQGFYSSLMSKKNTAADLLKTYKTYLSSSPFKKLAIFFANKIMLKAAEKASTLHIIDFGILYGFQWPVLIQHLAKIPGGPPKLRVTGIEIPVPGFRPAECILETGRRLARYCERFDVPFEYNPIPSQNWESIRIQDLKINKNKEVVAVNCIFRLKNLLDETVDTNCPRNGILNLIRKMNPDIFVNSVVSGSYNAPFFLTRFKEALFHFAALFDIFEATLPRENPERLMFEAEFCGREVMNVIACEGVERVERPETYKQWQVRIMRAGFKQVPLDKELVQKFRNGLKSWYHPDFFIDEDGRWLLQGWKGRILYASSCWIPA